MKSKLLVSFFLFTTIAFAQNKRIIGDFQNNEHIKSLKLNKLKSHANVNKNPNDVSSFNNVIKQRLDSIISTDTSYYNQTVYISDYNEFFTYDANGNNTLYLTKLKDSLGQWVFNEKEENSFNSNNKPITITYYDWNNNLANWIPYYKLDYVYDSNGLNIQLTESNWDTLTNLWKFSYKVETLYNSGFKLQDMYFNFDSNSNLWLYSYKTEYNTNISMSFNWDSNINQWIANSKEEYTFNLNNKKTQELVSNWNTSTNQWVASYKNDYVYNQTGDIIQYISSNWNISFNQWVMNGKTEYVYDSNGNMIQELDFSWNSTIGQWNNNYKSELSYNNNFTYNQLLLPLAYNEEPDIEIYFNNMLTEYRAFNMNNNGFWENNGIQNFYYSQQNVNALNSIEKSEIKIYPNPASTYLTINLTNNSSQTEFELFNIQGERLISKTIGKKETINIEHLSNGFYLYSLTVDGKKHTGKIVKND